MRASTANNKRHWPDLSMADFDLIQAALGKMAEHTTREINYHSKEGNENQVHLNRVLQARANKLQQQAEELSLSI